MDLKYVLITPARNEEKYIEETIRSVISQSIPPERWIIVSDASTDRTDEIVKKYLPANPWIKFLRMPDERDRTFAAKVYCFNAGYENLEGTSWDIIGNLDADISFGPGYFEFLLDKFESSLKLGVAGTPFVEDQVHYDYRFTNIEHVSGACQLFRRDCFEEIGGYLPIKGGGIDWVAVTTARMKGWETRTFTEKICHHHRKIGQGGNGRFGSWYAQGYKDYYLGWHPLWEVFRSIYQMKSRPWIAGGFLLLAGYLGGVLSRVERPVSEELIVFNRHEQMKRLKRIVSEVWQPSHEDEKNS